MDFVSLICGSETIVPGGGGGGLGEDSALIRRVCATGVLNLSPCSRVGKPKKDTLFWSYHSFLKSILFYSILFCSILFCCVVLCCDGDKDHVYASVI